MKKIINATRQAIYVLNPEFNEANDEKTLDVIEFFGVVLASAVIIGAMSIMPM